MITKRDLMNIESLFFLSAIDRYSGKRKASQALSTSVDTINKYVENFEVETGLKLLSSNSRGCVLTQEGQEMMKKVKKIKELMDSIYSYTEFSQTEELRGKVNFFTTIGVNAYFMPSDLSDFFDRYPNIHLSCISANKASELQSQDYDVGITYNELPNPDVVVVYSREAKCGLFASPDYLSKCGYPTSLEDLQENHRIIHKYDSENSIPAWKDIIKQAKHICYTSNNTFSVVESIKRGVGIGLIPSGFTNDGLVCLDNIPCDVSYTFYLFAQRSSKDIPRVRVVIDYYKTLMDRM